MKHNADKAQLAKVKNFVAGCKLAVLATVNHEGLPQAAVVGFSETENFEIIFATFATSRKYQNLLSNSKVAMVIGWDHGKTVQLEGTAEEITDPAQIENFTKTHLAKIPTAAKYVSKSQERFFKVKPEKIRYSDLSEDPWDIIDIKF